jgi:hypothetical protein
MNQNPASSNAESDPLIGRTLSRYTIQAKLGTDAAGILYQARDNEAAKEVIVRAFDRDVSSDAERMRNYERDLRAVSDLKHANIGRLL